MTAASESGTTNIPPKETNQNSNDDDPPPVTLARPFRSRKNRPCDGCVSYQLCRQYLMTDRIRTMLATSKDEMCDNRGGNAVCRVPVSCLQIGCGVLFADGVKLGTPARNAPSTSYLENGKSPANGHCRLRNSPSTPSTRLHRNAPVQMLPAMLMSILDRARNRSMIQMQSRWKKLAGTILSQQY